MLLLSNKLLNVPVMSIQTGGELARTNSAIIDPRNLHIIALYVDGALLDQKPSVLHTDDIRESGSLGFIIDNADKLMPLEGLVRLADIIDLDFQLIGYKVIDSTGVNIGKVTDYAFEPESFMVQQLYVRSSFLKSFTISSHVIHREQIISITKDAIVVEAPTVSAKNKQSIRGELVAFTNPFRNSPQPEPTVRR